MKREIRFKAKSKETGEWVFGMPIYKPFEDKCFMFPPQGICGSTGVEVDPDTVSQYTGVKDRNGVEIYEGDIVRCKDGYAGDPKLRLPEQIGKIEWDAKYTGYPILCDGDVYEVLVIGNEYDNPELLEELDV